MVHIGIDPGKSGGIAVIDRGAIRLCKLNYTEADVAEFLREASREWDKKAYIERVHSMPKQGVASSFRFGESYGFLRGLLIGLKIPFETVAPGVWQRNLRCLSKGDKNVTKARAQELFPSVKVTHAIADALLIAEFGRRRENGIH